MRYYCASVNDMDCMYENGGCALRESDGQCPVTWAGNEIVLDMYDVCIGIAVCEESKARRS